MFQRQTGWQYVFLVYPGISWVPFGHSPATASMSRNFHEYARVALRTFSLLCPPTSRFTAQRSLSESPSLFPTTVRFLELVSYEHSIFVYVSVSSHLYTPAHSCHVRVLACVRACMCTHIYYYGPLIIFDSGSQFNDGQFLLCSFAIHFCFSFVFDPLIAFFLLFTRSNSLFILPSAH